MKILTLVVALLAPIALSACTGDDSKESGTTDTAASDSGN